MATQFHEQVSMVLQWFLVWNECEQMVVLCSLLRRVSSVQARFVAQVFGQMFKNCTDLVTEQLELQANDPGFVSGLAKESKSTVLSHLLRFLPLVKVGNTQAKAEYLRIIPTVMVDSLTHRTDLEDCRHILSYLIIHPAFSRDELPSLSTWQHNLSELHQLTTAATPTALSSVPVAQIQAPSVSTTAQESSRWNNIMNNNLANSAPCSSQPAESQQMGVSGTSAKRLTIASNSGDSGFSEVEKCSSVGSFPVGRPLRPSASVPLAEGSHSGLARLNANTLIKSCATAPRREQLQSIFGQEKSTVQLYDQPSKLLSQPLNTSKNVPSNVAEWLNRHLQPMAAGSKLHPNLNSDTLHSPLSPQSSVASSGSGRSIGGDALIDERRMSQGEDIGGGMQDLSLWLKSLRLHKYAHLFQNMTYEEVLNLTDEWLEKQNVTKGARNKIVLSIQKLCSRQEALRQMEKTLLTPVSMKETIRELMQMLKTPMKRCDSSCGSSSKIPSSEHDGSCTTAKSSDSSSSLETESVADGDLPGHMTRLFGKICSQLLVDPHFDGECLSGYLQLLDRSLGHQSFTKEQKKKMTSWKQQIYRTFQLHAIQKQNLDCHHMSLENIQRQGAVHGERRALRGQQALLNPGHPTWTFGLCPSSVFNPTSQSHDHSTVASQSQCQKDSTEDFVSGSEGKQPLSRTKSAPIRSPQMGLSYFAIPGISQDGLTTDDIHASLDSLCISMTEHALEGGFGELL